MTVRPLAPLFACALLASVAACGGGGGGGGTRVVTPVPTPSPTPGSSDCSSVARTTGGRLASRGGASGIVPNQLFVTYKSGVRSTSSVEKSVSSVRSIDLNSRDGVTRRTVVLPSGADLNAAASTLRSNASVASVDFVHYRALADANDPRLNTDDQWYLYKENTDPGAWNVSHGANGVSVAIIDTGVDETNQDFVFDVRESVINGTRLTGAGTAQDHDGHGTNVAGLAAAQTNNGYGYAGVGYSTHVQAYKIFPDATSTTDCASANTSDEVAAINDAVSNGASVISLSLGSAGTAANFDQQEENAIEAAIAAGVTVVAAAGNSAASFLDYPAGYPGVIAVGASAVTDTTANSYASINAEVVASYSNATPTLVAPGGDATNDPKCGPGTGSTCDYLHWIEGYGTRTPVNQSVACTDQSATGVCGLLFNGTSQATPQVSGTVALMEAYHGGARSLTPAQVKSILTSTTDVISGSAAYQGAGRLNAGKAVAAAHP